MNDDRTEEEIGMKMGCERAAYGFCRQDLYAMGERAALRGGYNLVRCCI